MSVSLPTFSPLFLPHTTTPQEPLPCPSSSFVQVPNSMIPFLSLLSLPSPTNTPATMWKLDARFCTTPHSKRARTPVIETPHYSNTRPIRCLSVFFCLGLHPTPWFVASSFLVHPAPGQHSSKHTGMVSLVLYPIPWGARSRSRHNSVHSLF